MMATRGPSLLLEDPRDDASVAPGAFDPACPIASEAAP